MQNCVRVLFSSGGATLSKQQSRDSDLTEKEETEVYLSRFWLEQ